MKSNKREIKIALVGQPNVGKSMLINSISNAKLRVGNYSGVTVDREEVFFDYEDWHIRIIDLPGAYSLSDFTIEEKVTTQFLENSDYDLIINVVDSTNLERNLILTTELLELDKKMIIALNMIDEAYKEGIVIDEKQLSKILGVECIKVSASQKLGINRLIESAIKRLKKEEYHSKIKYSDVIEEEIDNIVTFLKEKNYKTSLSYRKIAIDLLQEKKDIYKMMHDEPIWIELLPIVRNALNHIYIHHNSKDLKEIFDDERNSFVQGAVLETIKYKNIEKKNITQQIDSILIHQIFGIPIFLFLMWGLFQLTFEVGAIPIDYIGQLFSELQNGVKTILGNGFIGQLIADGAIAGVGAVVMFLPSIIILFLGIALLETTGYMARVAFLLDGFFHKFGLHGKSFIPLVMGFGCSVPAYMSARTLKSRRDRLITLFIIGFMSCGARLPIYVLFTGAFFSKGVAGNVLFLIYISGAIVGLFVALFLRKFIFKGKDEPFVMEMPKYRLPSFRLIYHTVATQSWLYLQKAGTFILVASVLIWLASNYPKDRNLIESYQIKIENAKDEKSKIVLKNELAQKELEGSLLGIIGKATDSIFEPIGFNWKMTIALEAGLAAKEVVVSTLSVLYNLGETNNNQGLIKAIRDNISFPSAISFIVFVMFYLPCLAATAVFTKEAGSWKYTGYLFILTTSLAWFLSFIAFNITKIFF